MEIILALLFFIFFGTIVNFFFKALGAAGKTVKAAAKTVASSSSFKESLEEEFASDELFGKLILRLQEKKKDGLDITEVVMKGNLPNLTLRAYWGLKIYDITENSKDSQKPIQPVVSAFNMFRETHSIVYHLETPSFQLTPGLTYPNPVPLCGFFPEMLSPPYSGKRKLRIVYR